MYVYIHIYIYIYIYITDAICSRSTRFAAARSSRIAGAPGSQKVEQIAVTATASLSNSPPTDLAESSGRVRPDSRLSYGLLLSASV